MTDLAPYQDWLDRWRLTPDGAPIVTHSSHLLPVRQGGVAAMLKIADELEERRGCAVMSWWNGDGAAPVLEAAPGVLLLERALGTRSLLRMAETGQDDDATRILAEAALRLHAHTAPPPPDLVPLETWFRALPPTAATHGGIFARAWGVAAPLLAAQRDTAVLHGDIHHENILDFEARGWLAIDPKGVFGDPGYDFANTLCNPLGPIPRRPGRFERQLGILAETTGFDRARIAAWTLAYAGLSAAWIVGDGDDASLDLTIAELAAAELDRLGPILS